MLLNSKFNWKLIEITELIQQEEYCSVDSNGKFSRYVKNYWQFQPIFHENNINYVKWLQPLKLLLLFIQNRYFTNKSRYNINKL